MEIEIIQTSAIESTLDSTKNFGLTLNKTLSIIKMLHWYVLEHNVHLILGDLYDDLSDLFDKLQEEIIGTSKSNGVVFPSVYTTVNFDDISSYKDNQSILDYYYTIGNTIKDMLTSIEFNNYVTSVKSGITNTKEDIITRINKADYLLAMVKL